MKSFFELKKQDKPNENNNTSSDIPYIKPKSTSEPLENHHTINTSIEALNNDVDEKSIISEFSKREDLVFTKADKGGAIVILDVKDYIEKANKELKDENYYKRIIHDPTHINIWKSLTTPLKRFIVLAKNIADNLKTTNAKTPDFYITPKVHKKDVPGWPVVSSIDCHTSKLSKFVDHYLQTHTKSLPCYIEDATDFINKLENVKDTSKDSILVTLDVKALYTNIPNHEGIEAVKETLNNHAKKPIATRVIIKFLYLILTLNNFVFNGINYIQMKGCAMGTICAPAYANIFMGKFQKLHIFPYLRNFSTFYCRFIDDIFFLWNGTESGIIKFINNLN